MNNYSFVYKQILKLQFLFLVFLFLKFTKFLFDGLLCFSSNFNRFFSYVQSTKNYLEAIFQMLKIIEEMINSINVLDILTMLNYVFNPKT